MISLQQPRSPFGTQGNFYQVELKGGFAIRCPRTHINFLCGLSPSLFTWARKRANNCLLKRMHSVTITHTLNSTMFLTARIRPLARTIPRTALGVQKPVWVTAAARGFQSSALRFNTTGQDTNSTVTTAAMSSSEAEKETTAGMTEQIPEEPASEGEITARAYDFRMSPLPSSFVASTPYQFRGGCLQKLQ